MTRPVFWWSLGIALGLFFVARGKAIMRVVPWSKEKLRDVFRNAFAKAGLPSSWGAILIEHESHSNSRAVNLTGTDKIRGGAWGASQITEKTARAFGFSEPMSRLIDEPPIAADLTAQMVKTGFAERKGMVYRYGPPASLEEMAAVWNAGRRLDDPDLPPSVTTSYIPKLREAEKRIA